MTRKGIPHRTARRQRSATCGRRSAQRHCRTGPWRADPWLCREDCFGHRPLRRHGENRSRSNQCLRQVNDTRPLEILLQRLGLTGIKIDIGRMAVAATGPVIQHHRATFASVTDTTAESAVIDSRGGHAAAHERSQCRPACRKAIDGRQQQHDVPLRPLHQHRIRRVCTQRVYAPTRRHRS